MAWTEQKPAALDPLTELPSILTGNAIAFRQGIEKFSFWTENSGVSAGLMRYSDTSAGPGAARAFFDVESNVSSAISASKPLDGRLYITSDTSKLYGYLSGVSVVLGGASAIVWQHSVATIPTNVRTLVQTGSLFTATGTSRITFPIAYTATRPFVQATMMSSGTTSFAQATVTFDSLFTTSVLLNIATVYGSTSNYTVLWRSHGTITL